MNLTITTVISALILTSAASALNINGRFVVTPVTSTRIAVMLQLNSTTGTEALGGATIVFRYDTTSLNLTSNPVNNINYVFHNFSGGYYSPASITRPIKGKVWVNIDLLYYNNNYGTTISGTSGWTNVVTIYFDVLNPNAAANFYWLLSSPFWGIYKDDNLTLLVPGSFQNTNATTFQLSVNIDQDWNMVSIPGLLPLNQNVTNWWPGSDPGANVFKYFFGYNVATTASPGIGYWMRNLTAQTYNTGDEWPSEGIISVQPDPIPLHSGWSMVGGYEESIPAAALTTTPPGLIGGIFRYSNVSGYQNASVMEPGKGYWIKMSGDGRLNIPSGSTRVSKELTWIPSNEELGRIIITDAAQKSYTLYVLHGETDLRLFELPPYPPNDMFDIRYSSQRYAESLSSPQIIEMTGIQFPLKIRAERTDIILCDESGKKLARVEEGSEVTLSSSEVTTHKRKEGEILNSASKLIVFEAGYTETYVLEQNYPNPFNPSTRIRWHSPESGHHTLKVYDILGNEVKVLVDDFRDAGNHEVIFNADNLASGIYIYRLQTSHFSEIRKMILLR